MQKVIDYYTEHLSTGGNIAVPRAVYGEIQAFMQKGVENDLIIECMKISADKNIKGWRYAKGVLLSLLNSEVKTMEQYRTNRTKSSSTTKSSVYEGHSLSVDKIDAFWDKVPKL